MVCNLRNASLLPSLYDCSLREHSESAQDMLSGGHFTTLIVMMDAENDKSLKVCQAVLSSM